ncbi:MAG: hypothetical protein LC790_12010 [Actinobacteria bacterium]|nr:hypothetical protein [Actinomycetota bacterium]
MYGHSTRRFARALGVSASTVRGLEEDSNHDQLRPAERAQATRPPHTPGQTEIIPAPEMIYGLDPDLRELPPLGALSLVGRRPADHPGGPDQTASAQHATEQAATPD